MDLIKSVPELPEGNFEWTPSEQFIGWFVTAKRERSSVYFAPTEARRFHRIDAWEGRDCLTVERLRRVAHGDSRLLGWLRGWFCEKGPFFQLADWRLEESDCPGEADLWHDPTRLGRQSEQALLSFTHLQLYKFLICYTYSMPFGLDSKVKSKQMQRWG